MLLGMFSAFTMPMCGIGLVLAIIALFLYPSARRSEGQVPELATAARVGLSFAIIAIVVGVIFSIALFAS